MVLGDPCEGTQKGHNTQVENQRFTVNLQRPRNAVLESLKMYFWVLKGFILTLSFYRLCFCPCFPHEIWNTAGNVWNTCWTSRKVTFKLNLIFSTLTHFLHLRNGKFVHQPTFFSCTTLVLTSLSFLLEMNFYSVHSCLGVWVHSYLPL